MLNVRQTYGVFTPYKLLNVPYFKLVATTIVVVYPHEDNGVKTPYRIGRSDIG
jgi:hypothetical protein